MHAAWTGIRYSSYESAPPHAPALYVDTLDAGMVCPVLNAAKDRSLTPEIALQESCFEYDHRFGESGTSNPRSPLNDTMIDGVGINLHNNRMGISGFAQWYPFGVGGRYQEQDETGQFRFVIEERQA